jgi:hypothetical protein
MDAQDQAELDRMQRAYKTAVDEWVSAIRAEEALASVIHEVTQVDKWEEAHFAAEELRAKAEAAKKQYEAKLRHHFFGFE